MIHSRPKKIEVEIKAGFEQLKIILEDEECSTELSETFRAHYDDFYEVEVGRAGKKSDQIHKNTVIALGLRLGLELLIIEKVFSDPGIPSSFNLGIKLLTLAAEEGSSIHDLSWAARDLYKVYVGFYPHLKKFENKDKAAYYLSKLTTLAENNPNTIAETCLRHARKIEGKIGQQQEVKYSESKDFVDLEKQESKKSVIDDSAGSDGYLTKALKFIGFYSANDAPKTKPKQNTYGTFEMVKIPQESKSIKH